MLSSNAFGLSISSLSGLFLLPDEFLVFCLGHFFLP